MELLDLLKAQLAQTEEEFKQLTIKLYQADGSLKTLRYFIAEAEKLAQPQSNS